MNNITLIVLISVLSLFTFDVFAEQNFAFSYQSKNYFTDKGVLWVTEPNSEEQFQVNTRIITAKSTTNYSTVQTNDYLQQNNLTILRTATTGYSDIQLDDNADYLATLLDLENSGYFSVVEPTTFGKYLLLPNDPSYNIQWHLPMVSAEDAWELTTGNSSVIVAVLDSGTEFSHNDLGEGADAFGNVWLNSGEDAWADPNDPSTGNGVDDDNNGFINDWKGWDFDNNNNDGSSNTSHGTNVAGVVAAKTNNNTNVAGIAGGNNNKGTSIMICGVGASAPNGAVLDDAILYAAANGARVVQLSLSVGSSEAIDAAISEAYFNHGVLIINAAGNSGASSVGYPASNTNVMAVGASNQSDLKAGFSQFGSDLEVSAPGVGIVTLSLNNSIVSTSGTSFSAPLTSGVASLIMAHNPTLTNVEVRSILQSSADKVGGYDYDHDVNFPGRSLEMGYGRINALAALNLATPVADPSISVTKVAVLTTDNHHPGEADLDDVITFSVSVENTGDVDLTSLIVSDSMQVGNLSCTPTSLAPAEVATCIDYTYTVVQLDIDTGGSIDNTANATMKDVDDNDITGLASTGTVINQSLYKDGFE